MKPTRDRSAAATSARQLHFLHGCAYVRELDRETCHTTPAARVRARASSRSPAAKFGSFSLAIFLTRAPATVPTIAPAAPATAPSQAGLRMAVATVAPQAAPLKARQASGPGSVRSGANGNLSTSNSVTASLVIFPDIVPTAIEASEEPATRIILRLAAQTRSAGAVMDRRPAATPMAAGKTKVVARFMFVNEEGARFRA